MSTIAEERADRVAGFLSAFSLVLSGIALTRTPGLLATAAILLALVAARMTTEHRTLAGIAVVVGTLAFFAGMIIAVLTENPIY